MIGVGIGAGSPACAFAIAVDNRATIGSRAIASNQVISGVSFTKKPQSAHDQPARSIGSAAHMHWIDLILSGSIGQGVIDLHKAPSIRINRVSPAANVLCMRSGWLVRPPQEIARVRLRR
jgi:hypothetical protein